MDAIQRMDVIEGMNVFWGMDVMIRERMKYFWELVQTTTPWTTAVDYGFGEDCIDRVFYKMHTAEH